MKARGLTRCACGCGTVASTGTSMSRYAGRLWITAHLILYRRTRDRR